MRAIVVCAGMLAGCGRIDFESQGRPVDASSDVGTGDAPASCGAPAGDWVLVQAMGSSNSGAPTISVPVNATGGGNLIVVAVHGEAPGVATNVFDDAGSPYMPIAGTAATDGGDSLELWYTDGAGGGAMDVEVTYSTESYSIVAWEFTVVAAAISGLVNGIATGNEFENDSSTDNDGWAHLVDPHVPAGAHIAAWTSGSASYCSSAASFIVE